ncbi:hypothetical protein [Trujillonella endophytica]|uniref:Uncharacterized protein n=1 Tax=Trujillonella endophytica TaxID=673521 RepID=A0A1H8PUQ2_9ACTN|nr:hypothetical protein [Trujillella endophytica]SEO45675.1 hypothetical protein SAMN05660991_00394 [Trujillella endophytica]
MQGSGPDCGTAQQAATGPAWWLVDDGDVVLSGPYADQGEAVWATGPLGTAGGVGGTPAYGTRRESGRVARRPSPEDRAWLADLSGELERVGEEWDPLVDDASPLVGLLCQLGASLVEIGLPLHDCSGRTATRARGGVCLTPSEVHDGVVVAWSQHLRTTREAPRPPETERWLQETMNRTLAGLLTGLGFTTATFGEASGALVTGRRAAVDAAGSDAGEATGG